MSTRKNHRTDTPLLLPQCMPIRWAKALVGALSPCHVTIEFYVDYQLCGRNSNLSISLKSQDFMRKKKFLICYNASFTEQDCVKESKIWLHVRKLKSNELSAHVYICLFCFDSCLTSR